MYGACDSCGRARATDSRASTFSDAAEAPSRSAGDPLRSNIGTARDLEAFEQFAREMRGQRLLAFDA
jgi:hypothetical protein